MSIALLLAGCLGSEEAASPLPAARAGGGTSPPVGAAANLTQNVTLEEVDVGWDGLTWSGAWVCEPTQLGCHGNVLGEGQSDVLFEDERTIRAIALTLTWTASGPTTERLGLGVMTMTPDCADCPSENLADVTGPSPLAIDLADLNITLEDGAVLHIYAWGGSDQAVGPLWANAQPAQERFTVEGYVAVEVPFEEEE